MNDLEKALLGAAASVVVELAKTAGHDLGIALVARLGPLLSKEAAAEAWVALVNACRNAAARAAANGAPLPPEEWAKSLAITLNPDGSIPVANPDEPPDLGPA